MQWWACLPDRVILEALLDDEEERCEAIFPVLILDEHFLRQPRVKIPPTSNYAELAVPPYTLYNVRQHCVWQESSLKFVGGGMQQRQRPQWPKRIVIPLGMRT
eukprot:scpid111231/ scgid18987/ 